MPSPEDALRQQLQVFDVVGQVSTMSHEEVLCTGSDPQISTHSTNLASAFTEINQLSKTLRIGPVQQVIIGRSALPKPVMASDVDFELGHGGSSDKNTDREYRSDEDDGDDGEDDNNCGNNDNTSKSTHLSVEKFSNRATASLEIINNNKPPEFVVQSKVVGSHGASKSNHTESSSTAANGFISSIDPEDTATQCENNALITTTIAPNLTSALMGNKAMVQTTRDVLG